MDFFVHAILLTTVILDHCVVGAQSTQKAFWKSPSETSNTLETFTWGHVLDIKWNGENSQSPLTFDYNLVDLFIRSTCSRSWEKKVQGTFLNLRALTNEI